ncbi:MAG: EAL domain-containing protein [Gammaproteobacteria bacterium]|nr:EAL domain-containing protein [Gammaproteobacteria bacterium]
MSQNPTPSSATISLLLLDTDLDVPKAQTAALRQAGFSIHPQVLTQPARLEKALRKHNVDILICNQTEHEGGFDGRAVLQAVARLQPDLPVILVDRQRDPQYLSEALALGARDLIPEDDSALLCAVFRRELASLEQSRQASLLRQRLSETQERFNSLIHNSQEAIAYLADGCHLQVNRAYQDLFGFIEGDELIGLPLRKLTAHRDHQDLEHLLHLIADNQASGEVELCMHSQEYHRFDALINYLPASYQGQACTQISIRNLSKARAVEQRLQLLSDYDQETGLSSRHRFIHQLDELLPQLQQGKPGNLLYLDIGNMASIRARAGERASSKLLGEIGAELAALKEQAGLFARIGDHSFALLLRHQDKGLSANLAESLIQRLQHKTFVTPLAAGLRPQFSLGLAEGGRHIDSADEFLDRAFSACENARRAGPGDWRWHQDNLAGGNSADDQAEREALVQILEQIDTALAANRFRLFYQPVVSLKGDSRENYAVLVRLLGSDGQTLLPASFLEQAQAHGRMAAIDRWVIQQAIAELARQRDKKQRLNLFIQLSADSIRDEQLLLWICDCLQSQEARGPWLSFQLADKDVRSNPSRARELIKGLKRISCRLAINRFGVLAKYESLIKHLPLDYIKLDASYLKHLDSDPQRQRKLFAICDLAHAHGIKVIAGEVEEADCLRTLWSAGVDYLQGYLLQEPTESISYDFDID